LASSHSTCHLGCRSELSPRLPFVHIERQLAGAPREPLRPQAPTYRGSLGALATSSSNLQGLPRSLCDLKLQLTGAPREPLRPQAPTCRGSPGALATSNANLQGLPRSPCDLDVDVEAKVTLGSERRDAVLGYSTLNPTLSIDD